MGTMARSRVLVTGGAGFIGSHLTDRLLAEGSSVVVLDDLSTGDAGNLRPHERLTVVQGSVLDTSALREVGRVDMVFHLAGIVGMRLAADRRQEAFEVSETGTRNVLEATGSAPAVLFSSSAVYGVTPAQPAPEDRPARLQELAEYDGGEPGYALGKWRLEEIADEARATRPVLVVRPFNVVGRRQRSSYGMVLPTMVERALSEKPLTVYDDGRQSRCFTQVDAFVDCFFRVVDAREAWAPGARPVNIGSDQPTRILDLAALVLEETRSTSPIEHLPYETVFPGRRDVPARVPDTRSCRSLVGPVRWPHVRAAVRDMLQSPVRA